MGCAHPGHSVVDNCGSAMAAGRISPETRPESGLHYVAGWVPGFGTGSGVPTCVQFHVVACQPDSVLPSTIQRNAVGFRAGSSAGVPIGTERSDGIHVAWKDFIFMGSRSATCSAGICVSKSHGKPFPICADAVRYTKGGFEPGSWSGCLQTLFAPNSDCP